MWAFGHSECGDVMYDMIQLVSGTGVGAWGQGVWHRYTGGRAW